MKENFDQGEMISGRVQDGTDVNFPHFSFKAEGTNVLRHVSLPGEKPRVDLAPHASLRIPESIQR